jgi:hypothetical protein
MNVFDFRQFRISSSIHEMKVSFFSTWASDFAMINLSDFITHTSRARRNALNFFWKMIEASLKFSSIHSANSVRNEFHRSSSNSSFHSCILFSSMWVLDSYFFFDASSECSTLSVSFSLSRVETRLRLANDDSKVIYRFVMNVDLQKWMSTCRSEFEVKEFEIKLKKFKQSMRKSIRWIIFALTADSWQRDRLIDIKM